MNTADIDDQRKLACIQRELRLRRKAYPRWINLGRIEAEKAKEEIAIMEAIEADYAERIPDLFREDAE